MPACAGSTADNGDPRRKCGRDGGRYVWRDEGRRERAPELKVENGVGDAMAAIMDVDCAAHLKSKTWEAIDAM